MALDGVNEVNQIKQEYRSKNSQTGIISKQINMPTSKASKKITKADAEQAVNEPRTGKAVLGLLEKSPVGLGNQQTKEDLEKMGYTVTEFQWHMGAPVRYESADGGTITVYDGKGTAEMGENERKTVYKNGNYEQVTYYDENGKLTKCEIKIKSDATGLTDPNGRFTMLCNENGKPTFIR